MKQTLFSFAMSVLVVTCVSRVSTASEIYVCTDEYGVKTYGNIGNNKGCRRADLPAITTFPAPNVKKAPKDFPKVDDSAQRQRDADRKQILNDELKAEQKKLADLNAEFKEGQPDRNGNERNFAKYQERAETLKEDIARSKKNIDAIQREIGSN